MSKHSSDSNSRDRNRNYGRYYNHRRRSSSSSSTESSRHSRKHYSSRSRSRYHKKTKSRRRSSSSDYSSRHKHSSRTNHRDDSRSKKSYRRRNSSSSNESNASSNIRKSKSSRPFKDSENTRPKSSNNLPTDVLEGKPKDETTSSFQLNMYDTIKMENSIKEINQEGFVFKVFKPSSEQKNTESADCSNLNGQGINEEIINSLPVEKSTFVISNRDRLLSARHKLLTKQERCVQWAKYLFWSYKHSEMADSKQ